MGLDSTFILDQQGLHERYPHCLSVLISLVFLLYQLMSAAILFLREPLNKPTNSISVKVPKQVIKTEPDMTLKHLLYYSL